MKVWKNYEFYKMFTTANLYCATLKKTGTYGVNITSLTNRELINYTVHCNSYSAHNNSQTDNFWKN